MENSHQIVGSILYVLNCPLHDASQKENGYGVAKLKTYRLAVDTLYNHHRLLRLHDFHVLLYYRIKITRCSKTYFSILICSCCNNVPCFRINCYPKSYNSDHFFNLFYQLRIQRTLFFFKKQSFLSYL